MVGRDARLPQADSRRGAAVVGVLSLAVFMSSLDLFIVNLAFPYIGQEYPGTSLSSLSWVLNGYTIVFAAVLVPAGPVGRPDRAAAAVRGRAGGLHAGVGALRGGAGGRLLIGARVIQAVGAGLMVPASLSLLLAAVPAPARAGHRHLVGPGRPGCGAGPGHRRQPGPGQLALGVLDQHPRRHRGGDAGGPGAAREPGRGLARPP